MRIGIEAQRIFRKKKHGMDVVAIQLIRHLQQIDTINQYYIFVKSDVDDRVIQETSNFRIINIKGGPYPYWLHVLLPRAIKDLDLDVLHCTANTAPIIPSVPLILTLHDIIFFEQWNFTKGSWYQILGNLYRRWNVARVVFKSQMLVTVSNFENKNIVRHFNYPPDKVITVYNAAGDEFSKVTDPSILESVRKKYSLPEKYVFYIGNKDPRKNLVGVLRAMSILRKSNRLNFRLQMLDIDRQFLWMLASRIGDTKILNHIGFCGYVDEQDMPAVYSMATLFLYPSLREGFGIPLLEAMRCEVPVITSNRSSMPEVAGKAAILIDPENPNQLAEAITRVLNNDRLRYQLVQDALTRADHFSWRKTAEQYLELYQSVTIRGPKMKPVPQKNLS